jgi:nucleotide-binding universal stress UspA family protein
VKDGDVIRKNRTDKPLTELTLTLTSVSSVAQEKGDDAEGEDEEEGEEEEEATGAARGLVSRPKLAPKPARAQETMRSVNATDPGGVDDESRDGSQASVDSAVSAMQLLSSLDMRIDRAAQEADKTGDWARYDKFFDQMCQLRALINNNSRADPVTAAAVVATQNIAAGHKGVVAELKQLQRGGETDQSASGYSEVLTELKKLQRGGEDVPLPKLTITGEVEDWKPEAKKSKQQWSFGAPPTYHLEGWDEYLRRFTKNKNEKYRAIQQQGLDYAFKLLHVDHTGTNERDPIKLAIGTFQALYDDNILVKLLELPFLDVGRSMTRKILGALDHAAKFLLGKCELLRIGEARRSITLLRSQVLEPTKAATTAERATQTQARLKKDEARLARYMPRDVAATTVHTTMIDINRISRVHRGRPSMTPLMRHAANVAMNCQLVVTGASGHSGEISRLPETEMVAAKAGGRDWVKITVRKGAKWHG